jgi:hypothetical protein
MKLLKLSAACGIAFAAMTGQAWAQPAPFSTPDETVTLSGATAPDNFLVTIATGFFPGGFNRYQDDNGTPANFADDGRAWNAFYGTVAADAAIPVSLHGLDIMFIKRSRGGSVWGVNPVARAQRMAVIDINSLTCVLEAGIYRCPVKGIDPGLPGHGDPGNAGLPSDFGVSDVEPAMFKGPYNVEFGAAQLSDPEVARLTVRPVNTLGMGIVATNAVPDTTVISRTDYTGMLSALIQDWSQVDPAITTGNTQVVVCRRVQGSGTQTSYNWFFNNFPCQTAAGGTIAPARMLTESASGITGGAGTQADPFTIDPTAGYTVVENSGSGNVRDCLNRANSATDYDFRGDDGNWYRIQFGNSVDPFRAIAVLSWDSGNSANPPGANGWSFRYLEGAGTYNIATQAHGTGPGTGIAPSKASLMTAKWDFQVELAMQYRNVPVTNEHGDVIPALAGVKLDFVNEFIDRAGDPAFNTVNWTAALPPTYIPTLDANGVPTNNVSRATRGGNTCRPLQKLI